MEEIEKKKIEFDEKIKKLESRIDKNGFEEIEEWLEKKVTFLNIKDNSLLFIRKKPHVLILLILFLLSFLLPSPYILYVVPIMTILTILAILPCWPPLFPPPILKEWLDQHPNVRDAINWEFENSGIKNYDNWEECCKSFLQNAFEFAWYFGGVWRGLTIIDPAPNQYILEEDKEAITGLDGIHAFSLYISYVAHCLAVEMKERVPWSLLEYAQEGLEILLDGRHMFWLDVTNQCYSIFKYAHGVALPAPPDFSFYFFKRNSFIEPNRIETIVRIINWSRDNLVHFKGSRYFLTQDMEAQWQYRGFPPVSRIINGTISEYHPERGLRHYTAGCWGTLGFYRSIFRAINIPVKTLIKTVVTAYGEFFHAQVCFFSLPRKIFLSHGDSPYGQLVKATPLPSEESQLTPGESLLPPAREILIEMPVFYEWYVEGDESISRKSRELAITYLPDKLLITHCNDKVNKISHEDSSVYESLKNVFSVEYLEEQRLWQRLEEKIAAWGGCDELPNAYAN